MFLSMLACCQWPGTEAVLTIMFTVWRHKKLHQNTIVNRENDEKAM
jgi:hypothetical protein